jgi:hypothetical protein
LDVPFVNVLISALLEIDAAMPGYARRTAEAITAVHGRKNDERDYEQLLQRLAEVYIALRMVQVTWPPETTVVDEPVAPGSEETRNGCRDAESSARRRGQVSIVVGARAPT